MSEERSRYEVQEVGEQRRNGHLINHAILKRKSNGVLEEFMPNVGSLDNANFIIKALLDREESRRIAAANREHDFQESLKVPHVFLAANTRVMICYCGKPTGDPIHIPDPEEEK